jgi:hypothetical protein
MVLGAFSFLRNSWIGKAVAAGIALIAAFLFIRRSGYKAAEAKERERKADAIEAMKEIRDEVEALPDDDRRNELGRFVRRKK